ncbi:MAG: ribosome maturation factor RimM [Alphaproteobacteria bacterium]|nr:ribosome maturation factor RimM [Alphaproteobacteria bacterium]
MPLLVGEITAPHGVRGAFKVQSYTEDPLALLNYPGLRDAAGRVYRFQLLRCLTGGVLLVSMAGVHDRNQAALLRGTGLLIERETLPPTADEDEFYHTDLLGCAAYEVGGGSFG